jgi:hypothetical protein
MRINTAMALCAALVIGATSAASAGTKHHAQPRVSAAAYRSFGTVPGNLTVPGPVTQCAGGTCDPYNHQQVKCIGGACNPEWGIGSNE